LLQQRLVFGAYPEVVLTPNPVRLLHEFSADYLWKDVLQTGLIKTPDLIKRLLLLLAHQISSEVSVNELATQLGMARPVVERYLDLLEQTFVIFRYLPVALVQHQPTQGDCQGPQGVFWDTGICNALLNAFATEELRPDISLLWENWTIAEIAKRNALLGAPAELFFWHSRTQSEVDLVVKQDGCLRAFEIKWSGRRTRNRAFRDTYGVSVETIGLENPFVADLLEA